MFMMRTPLWMLHLLNQHRGLKNKVVFLHVFEEKKKLTYRQSMMKIVSIVVFVVGLRCRTGS